MSPSFIEASRHTSPYENRICNAFLTELTSFETYVYRSVEGTLYSALSRNFLAAKILSFSIHHLESS